MRFSAILDGLIDQKIRAIYRPGWNGKRLAVTLIRPRPPMQPYFIITDLGSGVESTWVPSVGDLLAEDWAVYSEDGPPECEDDSCRWP